MPHSGAAARPIALVSARVARAQDSDLTLLEFALRARGLEAVIVDWDDAQADWSRYALALLRSTWDYSARLSEFLQWLARAALATRIVNPPEAIRWNLDKHYLTVLRSGGVPIVPTAYAEPGADASAVLEGFLHDQPAAELVLKPAVGSGARDAQRYPRSAIGPMRAHMARLHGEHRTVMLQPYLERVDEQGETGLIYINGRFSHAIGKSAVLNRGHAPSRALFAPEEISVHTPTSDELELGARVFGQLPFAGLLYARLDLLHDAHGAPCVLELELAEPSLYLAFEREAPARLAEAVGALV